MYNLFIVMGLKIMYILGGFLWKTSKSRGTWDGKTLSLPSPEGQLLDPSNRADGFLLHLMETGECATDLLPPEVYGVPVKGLLTPVRSIWLQACHMLLSKSEPNPPICRPLWIYNFFR